MTKKLENLSKLFIVLFALSLIFFTAIKIYTKNQINNPNSSLEPLKSGNLSTDYSIDTAIKDIKKLGLNAVNIPIAINIDDLSSNDMTIDVESQTKATNLIKLLKNTDIKIILEPYPWIDNGSQYETDWNPTDINKFFWNWKTKVLTPLIDEVANPYQVDILNIGTGFNHMEYAHGYWIDLIDYVRDRYKGLVTYRTSWWITAQWDLDTIKSYEEKINNPLFGKLDFISIAAYFELTDNETNSVDNLVKALNESQIYNRKQNIKEEVKKFHKKWNKDIFFGELGFPRTDRASVHPWNPYQSTNINGIEQANCFMAYKQVFQREPWFIGFSLFAIGEDSVDKMYYPSNETVTVIKNWHK